MSDAPQGPGWWQASDGRFYPPHTAPGAASTQWADPDTIRPALPTTTTTSGQATAALILSIVAWAVCPILPAIVALVLASRAKREIADSYGRVGGEGLVTASRIIAGLHLGVSVLIIPILLAIAIPTFLGAQGRAADRATQSELRNAFTAEKTYFTDNLAWTADPETLRLIEPTLEYQPGERPAVEGLVYVVVEEHLLGLAGKSASGDCFYLMSDSTTFTARHAVDSACRRMQQQDYQPNWP